MTPQMLHATLASGLLPILSDKLDVRPKSPEQVIEWMKREDGLIECCFDEMDMPTKNNLQGTFFYCYQRRKEESPCKKEEVRFFILPCSSKTELFYTQLEREVNYTPATIYLYWDTTGRSEEYPIYSNSSLVRRRAMLMQSGISRNQLYGKESKFFFFILLQQYCEEIKEELRQKSQTGSQKKKRVSVDEIEPFRIPDIVLPAVPVVKVIGYPLRNPEHNYDNIG